MAVLMIRSHFFRKMKSYNNFLKVLKLVKMIKNIIKQMMDIIKFKL